MPPKGYNFSSVLFWGAMLSKIPVGNTLQITIFQIKLKMNAPRAFNYTRVGLICFSWSWNSG